MPWVGSGPRHDIACIGQGGHCHGRRSQRHVRSAGQTFRPSNVRPPTDATQSRPYLCPQQTSRLPVSP